MLFLKLGIFLKGDFAFGLYGVTLEGGGALLGISLFGPHEIMSTLFFGIGGGELGDSSSVSLFLLFEEPLVFQFAL